MDIYLLFRKKSPLTEEGLPWLRGAFEHEFTARRNSSGRAVVSAVLVRSLLACLDGAVQYAEANTGGDIVARVRSSSAPSSHAICAWKGSTFYIPHGEANKITYHAGVLAMLRALARPAQAADFWEAYQALQSAYILHGKAPDIQESLCRACDELYYFMRYANLLLTLMNPKPGDFCRQMGLPVAGDGPYYVIETPITSEIAWCPVQHLRIVAAGNFGRAYAVYNLDPALRRRFDTVLEFDYLESAQELILVQRRTGLAGKVAQALVQVSQETRRLMGNGEMPGCIDTGSLLNWAGKCARPSKIHCRWPSVPGSAVLLIIKCGVPKDRCRWFDLISGLSLFYTPYSFRYPWPVPLHLPQKHFHPDEYLTG